MTTYRLIYSNIHLGSVVSLSRIIFRASSLVVPTTPMTFLGFPPPKAGKRRRLFESVAELPHTIVFYESPHRIGRCLRDALEVFGDRRAALSRELTKLHEETMRGSLEELVALDEQRTSWKIPNNSPAMISQPNTCPWKDMTMKLEKLDS